MAINQKTLGTKFRGCFSKGLESVLINKINKENEGILIIKFLGKSKSEFVCHLSNGKKTVPSVSLRFPLSRWM